MPAPRFHSLGAVRTAIASIALIGLASTIKSAFAVETDTVTREAKLLAGEALIMRGTGPCCVTSETPWGVPGTDTLNTAIMNQIGVGNDVVVFGYSQSATIETLELQQLAALPADERPSPDQLAFVMTGDGNNPDGGLLERFVGAYIPSLDATFSLFTGLLPLLGLEDLLAGVPLSI